MSVGKADAGKDTGTAYRVGTDDGRDHAASKKLEGCDIRFHVPGVDGSLPRAGTA